MSDIKNLPENRPKLEDIYRGNFDVAGGGVTCPCGAFIYSWEQLFNHWEAGHYDKPIPPKKRNK
jgi:hypothetical protein